MDSWQQVLFAKGAITAHYPCHNRNQNTAPPCDTRHACTDNPSCTIVITPHLYYLSMSAILGNEHVGPGARETQSLNTLSIALASVRKVQAHSRTVRPRDYRTGQATLKRAKGIQDASQIWLEKCRTLSSSSPPVHNNI